MFHTLAMPTPLRAAAVFAPSVEVLRSPPQGPVASEGSLADSPPLEPIGWAGGVVGCRDPVRTSAPADPAEAMTAGPLLLLGRDQV